MRKLAAISPQNLAEAFISDVESGKLSSCTYIKQAVKRHKSDLKGADKRGFYFDKAVGEQAIELFSLFRHTSGQWAEQPFKLQPWQAFLIYCLFGWKKKESGYRRFTRAYIEVAKKNGKSEMAAGIALILAFFDGEYGAEVYSIANKMEQASICWNAGVQMSKLLRDDYPDDVPDFAYGESFNNRKILDRASGSFFAPLASETGSKKKTLDGKRPHGAIVDEYHGANDDSDMRNIESGAVNRTQPLIFVITTAGFNRFGPCYQMRKVVADILLGTKTDDSFFGLIFTLDEGDDWQDEKNWIKANPSIGVTPTWDAMREQYVKARNEGASAEINFKTKNLNIWTSTSATWVRDDDWMANAAPFDVATLRGRECFAGLDLASVTDLAALVLFFPARGDDERHVILPYFWLPEDGAVRRSSADGVPYLDWVRDALVEATPGNVIDEKYVIASILDLFGMYKILNIQYDRFNATSLVLALLDEGLSLNPFGQGFVSMNAPIKQLEKMILSREINHLGNPVLRWMCGNIQAKYDPAGNIKFDKAKSAEKIDGMVALAMAVGGWMMNEKPAGPSKYETEEIVVV